MLCFICYALYFDWRSCFYHTANIIRYNQITRHPYVIFRLILSFVGGINHPNIIFAEKRFGQSYNYRLWRRRNVRKI